MHRNALSLVLVLLFCFWTSEVAAQFRTADALTPTGSTEMPLTIDNDRIAVWSGGALVFVQDRYSAAPIFRILDRNGTQVSDFRFSIPGAALINIYDNSVARGSDGALAIVGTAYSDDSRGGMFVAWVSPDGQQQTIIRTSPFLPHAVTLASDGTIWVAGQEGRDTTRPLIRRYDKTGKLLGSFIPWSRLGTDPHTLPFVLSVLLPLQDGVLWYAPRAHTYFEFSSDGSVIERFKSAPHPEHDLTFVAVCGDGGVFASTRITSEGHHQTNWGIFTLDRQRREWSLIPRNERWGRLLGCDGTGLATTTDHKTISWLEPAGR